MKSISTLFRQLSLIVILISAFSLSAWGEEVTATLSFADKAQRTSFSSTQQIWEQNGITLTNNKSGSTSNVADYAAPARFYKSSEIIISIGNLGKIKQIVFDCNADDYALELKNSIGNTASVDNNIVMVTLDATSNTFTISSLSGQVRMDAITVTYNGVAPKKYIVNFHTSANDFISYKVVENTKVEEPQLIPSNPNNEYTKFSGWTTNTENNISSLPELFNFDETRITSNLNLYPVFARIEDVPGSTTISWQKVTNASDLNVNDKVVIAAKEYNFALSTTQNSNNRGQAEITKSENTITFGNNVQILTLEAGTTSGTFAFNTGSGYLYAASSSKNYLKTEKTLSANSSWKIIITDGTASIVAQGSNTRKTMQYNQSSSLFACYASASQKAITLYKKVEEIGITQEETAWTICYVPIDNIIIESGNSLKIDNTASCNTLTIESNFDEAGEVNVTAGALSANKVIIEKTIDASRWFFFSLPFDCDLNNVVATHSNGTQLKYADSPTTGDYVINYYDQTRNATTNKAWVELIGTSYTLKANQGYIIGHFGTGDVTVKFPSKDAVTISVPATKTLNYTDSWTAGDVENSTNGWNLIGMPYYQKPNNSSLSADINVYFATIPNDDGKTYTQTTFADADIAPFTSFFVQTTEAPTFTIAAQQNAAPMLRAKGEASKAVISLVDANGVDDKTTIINNPNNTNDYEIGHDLAKWIGYAARPQIYSIQGDDILAFNSLAIDNSTIIPLGVYAHTDGEYTFRLSEKSVGDLEGWELYDNETGKTTRLANEDLTIYLEQGTHEGRFEIRLQQRITTNCNNSMGDMTTWTTNGTLNIDNMPADAVVYIYDAVGRMIYVATPNANTFNYSFVARGVYNIVVRSADNTVSFKTIY